jgi:hypothetical protein
MYNTRAATATTVAVPPGHAKVATYTPKQAAGQRHPPHRRTLPSPAATPHNSSRWNNLHVTNGNESTNSVCPSAATTLLLNKYLYGETNNRKYLVGHNQQIGSSTFFFYRLAIFCKQQNED